MIPSARVCAEHTSPPPRPAQCQVHLREFYELNSRSHEVYEWAKGVDLPEGTTPHLLFRNLTPDVQAEMTRLVKEDWMGLRRILPELLQATEQYQEAEPLLRQVQTYTFGVYQFWNNTESDFFSCACRRRGNLFICFLIYLFIYLFINLFIYLFIYLSVHLFFLYLLQCLGNKSF